MRGATEILPGFFVVTTRSETAGTREMNELSLAIRSPKGLAMIVGCSHPGIQNILARTSTKPAAFNWRITSAQVTSRA